MHCITAHMCSSCTMGVDCLGICYKHASECMQDTVAAVQFAGVFEEVRGPLLAVMRDLADSLGQNAHMCAAMLAGAMVPCLPIAQVGCCPMSVLFCGLELTASFMPAAVHARTRCS